MLHESGRVPEDLEESLDRTFEVCAVAALAGIAAHGGPASGTGSEARPSDLVRGALARIEQQLTTTARRRVGPQFRRLERMAELALRQASETAATKTQAGLDRAERLAAQSPIARRAMRAAAPNSKLAGAGGSNSHGEVVSNLALLADHDLIEHVLELVVVGAAGGGTVLHAECGDGKLVELLVGRGLDAFGVDPGLSDRRVSRGVRLVAGGALEYLGATSQGTLGAVVLTGIVDRLRPGGARALASLAATRLHPGGTVVVIGTDPLFAVGTDPVASDLSWARPVHSVTWSHLFALAGLTELEVAPGGDTGAPRYVVSARRAPLPVPPR